jgi:hypothetical protein
LLLLSVGMVVVGDDGEMKRSGEVDAVVPGWRLVA